jgi:pantoate--beta-alanine ligase
MEGKERPGHFNGVLTVVMKLFNMIQPQRAYFGEKDYQQYLLIREMTAAFFMDIEIKVCPTIRETSGLAYSSRNNRLTQDQRQKAEKFATIFHQPKPCEELTDTLQNIGVTVEYLEEFQGRRFTAVWIDDIRLIDNYKID